MAYRIKDRKDPSGYYTGQDWDADANKAKSYNSQAEALQVINKHKMSAEAEEFTAVENAASGTA